MVINCNCLDLLRTLPDNSIDSIVTDPPYGLGKEPDALQMLRDWMELGHHNVKGRGFMGKEWDAFVPQPVIWAECLRVLKPGGHLLAFAGTRTQDLMALGLRIAGFEIRDVIAWVYGCLSEDSEVLTKDGWVRYHKAIHSEIMAYDVQNDVYQWEKPSRWNEYRVESDTAYRIQSDNTDQIVSRGHRCLVERDGMLTFVSADELTSVEIMPTLHDNFLGLQEARAEVLHSGMQRLLQGSGLEEVGYDRLSEIQLETTPESSNRQEKPSVEGRINLFQTQREVRESVDQICEVSATAHSDGAQGRLCNGTQAAGGLGDWQTPDSDRVCTSCEPRRNGQPFGESNAVCNQCGPQALRARASYNTTVATVTVIEYTGLIWCPTVSTGAFVARRNGKVFITGNSGFPKSMDVSKAIDNAAGAEQGYHEHDSDDPVTPAAQQWQGWGTALKPAMEPITVARKPLAGTVADTVTKYGTGAINIDGCRVATDDKLQAGAGGLLSNVRDGKEYPQNNGFEQSPLGRWPANLIQDGAADDLLGHAARFFYCPKASKADRNYGCDSLPEATAAEMVDRAEGSDGMNSPRAGAGRTSGARNTHPTVKPIELMRYLCRLVTSPGGTVLDPFSGSGTTGVAAVWEGFNFIGAEMEEKSAEIANARIMFALLDPDRYIDGLDNKKGAD